MVLNEMPVNFDVESDHGGRSQRSGSTERPARSCDAEAQIRERIPVWQAISRLWLAQSLTDGDLSGIAQALADSAFDWAQIERICVYEVAPVVHENLRKPGGVWGSFNPGWLRKAILRHVRNPEYRQDALRSREHLTELVAADWAKIRTEFRELRLRKGLSPAEQRGLLRLLQAAEGR
jgi:hypothetical protein